MAKKLAIDWDEKELRLVAAQCSGSSVKVTDAAVIPIEDSTASVISTLKEFVADRGLQSTETLVTIGRGKAELRELQLPPVPEEELPDMVRFQAVRSFASSGDRATVDYLVTRRSDRGVEMIAAAVDPDALTEIGETCQAADLEIKRIGLRPLSAAALYLTSQRQVESGDIVLIDLLTDDAEIVVARDGHVIFVRTVRMPTGEAARPKALAGELKRSLVACGSSGSLNRVVLWGRESVHRQDVDMLAEASGSKVEVLDPFDLVDLGKQVKENLPDHVGRLAPLVGLIAADEQHADRLIDFLNPREKAEEKPNHLKKAALIGGPIAAALLIGFLGYRHLKTLDTKIEIAKKAKADLQPEVDKAMARIDRTEKLDQFLDINVNWLNELRRLAVTMPPSDQMIVRSISATGDIRAGGGTMQVSGGVTNPDVIVGFEEALRDESHRVVGDGSTQQDSPDAYRWTARESITIPAEAVRNARYAGLAPTSDEEAEAESPPESPPDQEASSADAEEPESVSAAESTEATEATEAEDDAGSESTSQEPAVESDSPDVEESQDSENVQESEDDAPELAATTKTEVAS